MGAPKVVVLGMVSKMPVGGVVWQAIHYMEGLRRLGFDPYYVEAHARTPSMFMDPGSEDGAPGAAAYLDALMRHFGFQDRWAYHALHSDGRCFGLSSTELSRLYDSSELLLNLHGGTLPLPEHVATGRLAYIGTDPVQLEVELFHGNEATIAFLDAHSHHFTFGENYGNEDCLVPVTDRYDLVPTRQPVVLEFWGYGSDSGTFTTIGNWRQEIRDLRYRGETYTWSKHDQFLEVLDLPRRTTARLELALASASHDDRELLSSHGWSVRDAQPLSSDANLYRAYIATSGGEFTVAKDQNARLRSGWFSDRSATYLASGRPVVTQDTGFGAALPTGRGLLAFHDLDSAAAALEEVQRDNRDHRAAAREIALEYFDHGAVLRPMMSAAGVRVPRGAVAAVPRSTDSSPSDSARSDTSRPEAARPDPVRPDGPHPIPHELVLTPVSRHPIRLPDATEQHIGALDFQLTEVTPRDRSDDEATAATDPVPETSVIVLTHNQLSFTRLCMASLLRHSEGGVEFIVIDNASTDGTPEFLEELSGSDPRLRVVLNKNNRGFAAANNQGVELARGQTLVLLNNDTVVPPGWLGALTAHLEAPGVGAVGPVTNRIGNEAEIETEYETYGEFLELAAARGASKGSPSFAIPTLTMFCFAIRRAVFDEVGPLDESFGVGTLEDDDYSLRIADRGLSLRCAEDVVVHHFGRASFGEMVTSGEYGELLRRNRQLFADKWGRPWTPYARRTSEAYSSLTQRVRVLVDRHVPESATVLVVSRGDEQLVDLGSRRGWHLPQAEDGVFAGHYPRDSREAIEHLEDLRAKGGQFLVFPTTSQWWLEFYGGLREHLNDRYAQIAQDDDTGTIYALAEAG